MSFTGKDLLAQLQSLTEEQLNQPIYVYADHGQEHYQASQMMVDETATSLEYCLEEYYVHPEDREEYEAEELKTFIVIE